MRLPSLAGCYTLLSKPTARSILLPASTCLQRAGCVVTNEFACSRTSVRLLPNCLRYFQAAASSPGLFQPSAAAGVPTPRFHDIIDLLTMDHPPPFRTGLALDLAAERLKQIHRQHMLQHNATILEQRIAERKASECSMGAMCKDVRGSSAPPSQRLIEVVQNKEIIQTHPLEVDRIIRDSLGAVYQAMPPPETEDRA